MFLRGRVRFRIAWRLNVVYNAWKDGRCYLDLLVSTYQRPRDIVDEPLLRIKCVRIVKLITQKLRVVKIAKSYIRCWINSYPITRLVDSPLLLYTEDSFTTTVFPLIVLNCFAFPLLSRTLLLPGTGELGMRRTWLARKSSDTTMSVYVLFDSRSFPERRHSVVGTSRTCKDVR